jgi:hypothetical protein
VLAVQPLERREMLAHDVLARFTLNTADALDLAQDASTLYWVDKGGTNTADLHIRRIGKDGSGLTAMHEIPVQFNPATGNNVFPVFSGFDIDETYVFWRVNALDEIGIFKMPQIGTTSTPETQIGGAGLWEFGNMAFDPDGSAIFVTDWTNDEVFAVNKFDGSRLWTLTGRTNADAPVAADWTNVYWVEDLGGAGDRLMQASHSGGSVSQVAFEMHDIVNLAADVNGNLFWLRDDGAVVRRLAGSTNNEIFMLGAQGNALAVDYYQGYVYFVRDSTISYTAKTASIGQQQQLLPIDLAHPLDMTADQIVVDERSTGYVYWISESGLSANEISVHRYNKPSTSPLRDSVGLYDAGASAFFLRNTNDAGVAQFVFNYGPGGAGWQPVVGDWDSNPVDKADTIGLYDPINAVFYLRNTNGAGNADLAFAYGPPGAGWQPIAGDWNGDGVDTIGLYNPATSVFYLRNTNGSGNADLAFGYGPPGAGWQPIVGDWDGNGADTIGLYNPANSAFYLRNTNSSGNATVAFAYGPPGAGWQPIAGDWDADANAVDTVGLYDPATSVFFLRNSHTSGNADVFVGYGPPGWGWQPLAGDWDGSGGSSLLAAGGEVLAAEGLAPLTQADLQPLVDEAVRDWTALGLAADRIAPLLAVEFVVADLPGAQLGWSERGRIYLDRDAAGHGWFVDPTPGADEEFSRVGDELHAIDPLAADRIDLLTVVSHELGHMLGLADLDAASDDLMSGWLATGVRREPGVAEIDAVFAGA